MRSLAIVGCLTLTLASPLAGATPTRLVADAAAELLPPEAAVVARALDGERLDVYLDLPAGFVGEGLDEPWLEAFVYAELQRANAGTDERPRVRAVLPWAVDPAAPGLGWQPLASLLPPIEPPPRRDYERERGLDAGPAPPFVSQGADAPGVTPGFLSGKTVYVSPGHGWTWSASLGRWYTQRGNTNGIVEDLVSTEAISHYLVHYLKNAGAQVFTVREHDRQTNMVIVDAAAAGASLSEGGGLYEESGTWADSSALGFQAGNAPYTGQTNPHELGATRYAYVTTGEPTAWARWTPDIPEEGGYAVYLSYAASGNRAPDARFVVRHAGGETEVRLDQTRHGGTWVELGHFWFRAGQDAEQGSVTLFNDTLGDPTDTVVSADAVRFGGGFGSIVRGDGSGVADGPTSGRPRWEENARMYAQFAGAPPSVYDASSADNNDDVGTRSRLAAWHNEPGEDAVYVAWHSNAPDPGRGTSTFVYGPNPPDGTFTFTGVAGSDDLGRKLQDEIVGDIRAAYDPGWRDRGLFTAYFGEVNPSHNPEMPSALVEVAFHDTAADADYLEEPRFRQLLSRAFYQAIVKYFAERDGVDPVLLPEPPNRVRVTSTAGVEGEVVVAWDAPFVDTVDLGGDAATAYKVYRSADGRAFDNGTLVEGGGSAIIVTGLEPGVPAFFRVTAVNAGGESFPSPAVAVVPTCGGAPADALMVHGFYRFDSALLPVEDLSAFSLGDVVRLRQDEVNTYDYLVEHAWAFAAAGLAFDGAEATAIEDAAHALDAYRLAIWQLGEESTEDETFSDAEQAAIATWLGGGGDRVLIASGAEIGWDLEAKGTASDTAFLATWFGAAYASDDAGVFDVVGAGALASVAGFSFDDGSHGTYEVEYPDVLTPLAGAAEILSYPGVGAAGVSFQGADHRAVLLGFPLETVVSADARATLAAALVDHVDAAVLPATCPSVGPEPSPDAGGAGDAGPAAPDEGGAAEVPTSDDLGGAGGDAGASDLGGSGGGPTVTLSPVNTFAQERRLDDGGCSSSGSGGPRGAAVLALLAVLGLVARRRQRYNP